MFRSIRRAGNLLLLHLVAKYLRCALFTFYLVSQMVFVRVVRFVSAKGLDAGVYVWGLGCSMGHLSCRYVWEFARQ